jgi:hypothetical protein
MSVALITMYCLTREVAEGNTIFYDHLELNRRRVDALAPKREESEVDKEPLLVHYDKLLEDLLPLKEREVVWIGAVISPEKNSFPTEILQKLQVFDKLIAICPDC